MLWTIYEIKYACVLRRFSHVRLFRRPMDCSPPGFSIHGISQARILEWVTMPSSRGLSWPKKRTWVSWVAGRFFTHCITWEAPVKQLYPNKKLKKEAGLFSLWALTVPMSWNSEPMILWNYFHRIIFINPSEMCRCFLKWEQILKKREKVRGRQWWYYNKWLKNEGRKKWEES